MENQTYFELRASAKHKIMKVYSGLRKARLVRMLEAHQSVNEQVQSTRALNKDEIKIRAKDH